MSKVLSCGKCKKYLVISQSKLVDNLLCKDCDKKHITSELCKENKKFWIEEKDSLEKELDLIECDVEGCDHCFNLEKCSQVNLELDEIKFLLGDV